MESVFVHYRTPSFILNKIEIGESDAILKLYTKDFGKLEILAKGVRKITSKLRGGIELFCFSDIEFIQGRNYKIITDAVLIEKFRRLRSDLIKLKIAYQVAKDIEELLGSQEQDLRIWCLLRNTFYAIEKGSFLLPQRYAIFYYYFFWNFVSLLGYRPNISDCKIQNKKVDCNIIKIIKIALKRDLHTLTRLNLNERYLKLLKITTDWYRVKII